MPKISAKYRAEIRREAAAEAVAEERRRMRRNVRYLIQQATKDGQNAVTAHWLATVLRDLEG